MKITRIDPFVVEQKLACPFAFSQKEYDHRSVCLVRATCNDGSYGWGEGYGPAEVVAAAIRHLSPLVIDTDPLRSGAIWETMHRNCFDHARSGVMLSAISAIDIALWDLKGKILDQPVHSLLGGRRRDRVRVYATGMYFTPGENLPGRLAAEAAGYVEQGYTAVKMKVGLGEARDVENVRAVREAIGPDVQLMIDSNHAFSYIEALSLSRALEPFDIAWFEEPISPEDYSGYARLRVESAIPLAAGECEYLSVGFRRLFEGQCVDIAQPDICATGGLTEMQRIVALARAHLVEVAPHCWGTGIAFAAALHLTSVLDPMPGRAAMPEPILEMDRTENPLRDQLIRPRFEAANSFVAVPMEPGLGVDVDSEYLEQFAARAIPGRDFGMAVEREQGRRIPKTQS